MLQTADGLWGSVERLLRRNPQGASGGPVATATGPYRFR